MAKEGNASDPSCKYGVKKPAISGVFIFDSEESDYDENEMHPFFASDYRPPASPPYYGSMRNAPYHPSRFERVLDWVGSCLAPIALCSMGKNPFSAKSKRMLAGYRNSRIMDQYLLERIKHKQESGELALLNPLLNQRAEADQTVVNID